jgi:hypothetical protein
VVSSTWSSALHKPIHASAARIVFGISGVASRGGLPAIGRSLGGGPGVAR